MARKKKSSLNATVSTSSHNEVSSTEQNDIQSDSLDRELVESPETLSNTSNSNLPGNGFNSVDIITDIATPVTSSFVMVTIADTVINTSPLAVCSSVHIENGEMPFSPSDTNALSALPVESPSIVAQIQPIPMISPNTSKMSEAQAECCSRVLGEILSTERAYVSHLDTCMTVFVRPIEQSADGDQHLVVSQEECRQLFSNIDHCAQINIRFLKDLELCLAETSPGLTVSDPADVVADRILAVANLFHSFAPRFKMYTMYTANFNNSHRLLTQLLADSDFEVFHEFLDQQAALPCCRGNNLGSYLIMPVQRIPRYILLLKELLKQSSSLTTHHLMADSIGKATMLLLNAIKKLEESAAQINESIRSRENGEILSQIQTELGDSVVVFAPGRRFIRRGKLMKIHSSWTVESSSRDGKVHEFFLFSDLLMYVAPAIFGADKVVQLPFDVATNVCCVEVKDACVDPYSLPLLQINSTIKTLVLQFDTVADLNLWKHDIAECADQHMANHYTRAANHASFSASTNPAAVSTQCEHIAVPFSASTNVPDSNIVVESPTTSSPAMSSSAMPSAAMSSSEPLINSDNSMTALSIAAVSIAVSDTTNQSILPHVTKTQADSISNTNTVIVEPGSSQAAVASVSLSPLSSVDMANSNITVESLIVDFDNRLLLNERVKSSDNVVVTPGVIGDASLVVKPQASNIKIRVPAKPSAIPSHIPSALKPTFSASSVSGVLRTPTVLKRPSSAAVARLLAAQASVLDIAAPTNGDGAIVNGNGILADGPVLDHVVTVSGRFSIVEQLKATVIASIRKSAAVPMKSLGVPSCYRPASVSTARPSSVTSSSSSGSSIQITQLAPDVTAQPHQIAPVTAALMCVGVSSNGSNADASIDLYGTPVNTPPAVVAIQAIPVVTAPTQVTVAGFDRFLQLRDKAARLSSVKALKLASATPSKPVNVRPSAPSTVEQAVCVASFLPLPLLASHVPLSPLDDSTPPPAVSLTNDKPRPSLASAASGAGTRPVPVSTRLKVPQLVAAARPSSAAVLTIPKTPKFKTTARGVSAAAKLSAQPTSEEREIELVRASMEQERLQRMRNADHVQRVLTAVPHVRATSYVPTVASAPAFATEARSSLVRISSAALLSEVAGGNGDSFARLQNSGSVPLLDSARKLKPVPEVWQPKSTVPQPFAFAVEKRLAESSSSIALRTAADAAEPVWDIMYVSLSVALDRWQSGDFRRHSISSVHSSGSAHDGDGNNIVPELTRPIEFQFQKTRAKPVVLSSEERVALELAAVPAFHALAVDPTLLDPVVYMEPVHADRSLLTQPMSPQFATKRRFLRLSAMNQQTACLESGNAEPGSAAADGNGHINGLAKTPFKPRQVQRPSTAVPAPATPAVLTQPVSPAFASSKRATASRMSMSAALATPTVVPAFRARPVPASLHMAPPHIVRPSTVNSSAPAPVQASETPVSAASVAYLQATQERYAQSQARLQEQRNKIDEQERAQREFHATPVLGHSESTCEVTLSAAARLAREARVERLRELEREAGGSTGSFRALPIPASHSVPFQPVIDTQKAVVVSNPYVSASDIRAEQRHEYQEHLRKKADEQQVADEVANAEEQVKNLQEIRIIREKMSFKATPVRHSLAASSSSIIKPIVQGGI